MDGADYLAQCATGAPPALGRRVVVIGGGSAALDVARSARRAGHDVTILALEHAQQMPAQREEVAEALEEGIALVDGAMLDGGLGQRRGRSRIDCVRVRFEAGAARGQFTVTPVPASEFSLAADAVLPAIGQDPDLSALSPRLATAGGLLSVDATQATSDTQRLGRRRRRQHGALRDRGRRHGQARGARHPPRPDPWRCAGAERATRPSACRTSRPGTTRSRRAWPSGGGPPAERVATGAEVQLGLDVEQALAEAARCFSCGTCTHCDNCFNYCPDLAITHVDGGYAVLTDYCKGCGLCVKECPTGSMMMEEEIR